MNIGTPQRGAHTPVSWEEHFLVGKQTLVPLEGGRAEGAMGLCGFARSPLTPIGDTIRGDVRYVSRLIASATRRGDVNFLAEEKMLPPL